MNKKAVTVLLLVLLVATGAIGVFWHPFWWLLILVGGLIALAAGVSEILYTPAGSDLARETRAFYDAVSSLQG